MPDDTWNSMLERLKIPGTTCYKDSSSALMSKITLKKNQVADTETKTGS
jgi:hypothetical protein